MLTVEDWAEIRRLHLAEGLGKQAIAKRFGIARNTVKAAPASADPPVYRRRRHPSAVDPVRFIQLVAAESATVPIRKRAAKLLENAAWSRRGWGQRPRPYSSRC